jgi:hypothetical protein
MKNYPFLTSVFTTDLSRDKNVGVSDGFIPRPVAAFASESGEEIVSI